jgi:arylsulfatase A-like enzyme
MNKEYIIMARPNVVLINCDDMGYGDLGCYGSKVNHTPTIDHLASEGLKFDDFYMAAPLCSPSRGGMLTGCYPPRIGFGSFEGKVVLFPGQGVGLNKNETTISGMLKASGYRTKIIGKWHCGDQKEFLPLNFGFDEYYGLPYSNDMGRQPVCPDNPPLPLIKNDEVIQEQPDQRSLTERYVEQAVSFIRENKANPFFLYFAHMHVHLPLFPAIHFLEKSENGDFGACMEAVDWSVSCILDELKKNGLENDTLIIFTSDNGSRGDHGASNKPLRGAKATTWEGGQRVPCIFYWPGHIRKGVSREITASIDFLPTLASLCGIQHIPEKPIDGVDISEFLFNPNNPNPRKVFFYYFKDQLEAVRSGDWKLHVHKENQNVELLYNLKDDIGEQNNLYEKHPEIVKELSLLLEHCGEDIGDSLRAITGKNIRPSGKVDNPKCLTQYHEDHPYIIALYDSEDVG